MARYLARRKGAERVDELKGETSSDTAKRQGGSGKQRRHPALDLAADERREPLADFFAGITFDEIPGERLGPRGQHPLAGDEAADGSAAPAQHTGGVDRKGGVGIGGEKLRAGGHLAAQHAVGGDGQHPHLDPVDRIGDKAQTVEPADIGALDANLTRSRHRRDQFVVGSEPAHQKGGAAVNKALGDAVVQRVGEPVLDTASALLPSRRPFDPVAAMGDVGPGAGVGDAHHQGVDVAIDAVEIGHLPGDPGGRQPFFRAGKMSEDMGEQPRVAVAHNLAEIGDLADFPKEP